jgi:hypothetical protein
MPGTVHHALSRRAYVFDITDSEVEIVVARGIDATAYRWAILSLQLWAMDEIPGGESFIRLSLHPEAPSADDPSFEILGQAIASITLSEDESTASVPALYLSSGPTGASSLALLLTAFRDDPGRPVVSATLGVDVVLKC